MASNIGSVRMSYMYGTCCVPFLFRKPLVKNTFFKSFPQETFRLWISKIRIWIWSEESTRSVDFMDSWSVFGFVQKNAKSVFGFRNWRIWIFPKKRTQCRNNVATEWCAKNRCCELSLVTSPLATTTRRQRERKNNNRVYWTKQQVCTYITLLCTFVTARQGRENAWFYVLWRT